MTAILVITMMQSAHATLINDDYVGGIDHGRCDVIGSESTFDILSMDVELIGNSLSASITTDFAGRAGAASWTTDDGEGIGYGDLFLSNSWNPYGSAADSYVGDNFNSISITDWSYAFSIGNTGQLTVVALAHFTSSLAMAPMC